MLGGGKPEGVDKVRPPVDPGGSPRQAPRGGALGEHSPANPRRQPGGGVGPPAAGRRKSGNDSARIDLKRLVLLRIAEYSEHASALEPQGQPIRGGHVNIDYGQSEEPVQLVRGSVRAVVTLVDPRPGRVQ